MTEAPPEFDIVDTFNIGITGHRPHKMDSYKDRAPIIKERLSERLDHYTLSPHGKRVVGLSGLALGVDQLFIEVCNDLHIPWVGFVPCVDQDRKWTDSQRAVYRDLLRTASGLIYPSGDSTYTRECMWTRNRALVDNCDRLLAVWNGSDRGGTTHAISYAGQTNKEVWVLDPGDLDVGWFPHHPAGTPSPVEESNSD
jgi:uncharacterized phage-like protein YoqJ